MQTIYLNDFQIHSNSQNLGYVAHVLEGVSFPSLRQTAYARPGENGAIVANNLYDGRLITLTGTIFADTATQFQQRRRDLSDAISLARDSFGSPIPITLKMTTLDSLSIQIDCYLRDFVMKAAEMNGQDYLLQLFAPNPEFLSQAVATTSILKGSGGGVTYPVIYPVVYGANVGNEAIITNNGTTQTWPIIYLNGPLTNPIIFNQTLGRYIALDLTIDLASQVVIDMRNRTIIKDNITNVLGTKSDDSLFWWLEKGQNLVKLFTSDNVDTGNASIDHQDAYIGL